MGHVPHSPSYQEFEFEGLLHGMTSTKAISLSKTARVQLTISHISAENSPVEAPLLPNLPFKSLSSPPKLSQPDLCPAPKNDDHSDSTFMSPIYRTCSYILQNIGVVGRWYAEGLRDVKESVPMRDKTREMLPLFR